MKIDREMTIDGNIINLDRGYYSKHPEIYAWLQSSFGDNTSFNPNGKWKWNQIFGYTCIEFKDAEAQKQFETWIKTI